MKDQVIRMFSAGLTIPAIGNATGLPAASVMAILLRAGKTLEVTEYRDEALRAEVLRRYKAYEPLSVSLRELGVTKHTYWLIVAEEGATRAVMTRQIAKERADQEVAMMYQKGAYIDDIIVACGTSRPGVYRALRRVGLEPDRLS